MSEFNKKVEAILAEGLKIDNDLAKSLGWLVKNNGGLFKSPKQATFILSAVKKGDDIKSSMYKGLVDGYNAIGIISSEPSSFKGKMYKQVYFIDKKGVIAHYSAVSKMEREDYSERIVDAKRDMRAGGLSHEEYMDIVDQVKQAEKNSKREVWMHSKKWLR